MPDINIPAPNAKQIEFFRDRHKYIAYGGARGGGKSWAVRVNALMLAARHPGINQMIIRRSYPELYANHIKPFLELLPRGSYKYNDSKKEMRLTNGSIIVFRYCANDKDLLNFQGTECDVMYIDEATQLTEEQFKVLSACVRGTDESRPKHVYLTCNPGGVGHQWVKRLFIDRQYNDGERAEEYSFIQAGVRDNKALMEAQPDYIAQLEALPERLRQMWLDGSWDVYIGQFFEDFRIEPDVFAARAAGCEDDKETLRETRRWCHVIKPFDVSAGECAGWRIIRSYDFGYGKPFSCGWWAIDYEGVMYRILELYGCTKEANEGVKWTPDQQFAEIARIERTHPWLKGRQITGVADPAIWDASRGESINETAVRHGVLFTKGDNNRIPGWMQCHYRLQFDDKGYARMYVFDNCKDFIRTIPVLCYDEHKVEDIDTEMEDHIADEWRYAMMSRPVKPLRAVKRRTIMHDPLEQFTERR